MGFCMKDLKFTFSLHIGVIDSQLSTNLVRLYQGKIWDSRESFDLGLK